jgi:small subunit ribosomal protein S1
MNLRAIPAYEPLRPMTDAIQQESLAPLDPEILALLSAPVTADALSDALQPGILTRGTVEEIDDEWVYVRLNEDAMGRCPIEDAPTPGSSALPEIGGEVPAFVEVDFEDGRWGVSISKGHMIEAYNRVRQLPKSDVAVRGRVNQVVRGGFAVDAEGMQCFLPGRESGISRDEAFDAIGQSFFFDVIRFDKRHNQTILSRRRLASKQQHRQVQTALENLEVGAIFEGPVTSIKPYGVFVDLGGVDGLCHISELSLQHLDDPAQVVSVGQIIEVKVVGVDPKKGRISLSRRDLLSAAQSEELEQLGLGEVMTGTVTRLADFGAFIQIREGIEGLCHVSELSWTKRIGHPSEVLNVGDSVQVRVLEVKAESQRISLSLRQTQDNPWATLVERQPVGSNVTGKITRMEDYGLFVEIADGVEGLCHISDLTWEGRPDRPSDVDDFQIGQDLEVRVLDVDAARGRIKLGRKQLSGDPWDDAGDKIIVGTIFTAPVVRFDEMAAYLQVAEGLEARLHISQISIERVDSVRAALRMNEEVEVMTTGADRDRRRLDVSIKAIAEKILADTPKSYEDEGALHTFGDALMKARGVVVEPTAAEPTAAEPAAAEPATAEPAAAEPAAAEPAAAEPAAASPEPVAAQAEATATTEGSDEDKA